MAAIPIGIDLGTTYSCIACFKDNRPEVIINKLGNRTTPSWVMFSEGEYDVGESAMKAGGSDAIFDAKRMIGLRFDDVELQKDMKRWPFSVVNIDGFPKVQFQDQQKMLSPEEISSHVLSYLKGCAETALGCKITDVVITVPAYFSHTQRQKTTAAAKIAELNVLKLLSEPLAGALTFGHRKSGTLGHVLVFDLGGGTFDVSIVKIDGKDYHAGKSRLW